MKTRSCLRDRYNAEEGYFKQKAPSQQWSTNFVADVRVCQTYSGGFDRGGGAKSTVFRMVKQTVKSHVSLWGVGAYKKAHRHGPGIHVLIIRGTGYSLMWQDGKREERDRVGTGQRVRAAGNVVSSTLQRQRRAGVLSRHRLGQRQAESRAARRMSTRA